MAAIRTIEDRAYVHGLSIGIRRKRDGFTRVEMGFSSLGEAEIRAFTEGIVTIYLTDDERRAVAAKLLEGIEPEIAE